MKESFDKIRNDILNDFDCELKDNAKNLVFGEGNSQSDILCVGEAPGKEEDLTGIPFIGESGRNLNKNLSKIELSLNDFYITNLVKYRTQNNRKPKISEIKRYAPFLIRQIKSMKPKIIIPLGLVSSKFCLNGFNTTGLDKIAGMDDIHGKIFEIKFEKETYKIFPMYHPSSNVSSKIRKQGFVDDFIKLKEILENL